MKDEWTQDPYAQEWLSKLAKEKTRIDYIQHFSLWLNFVQMSPTEQIKKRVSDLENKDPKIRRWFEDKLVEFTKTMANEGYTQQRIQNYKTPVLSFFSHHRAKLSFKRAEPNASTTAENNIISEWIPSQDQTRQIYQHGNTRDKALLLVLYQSGFSETDVSNFNIEQLPNICANDGHYPITLDTEKKNVIYMTCLSEEAVHDVKAMLRESGNPTVGPLFISQKGTRLDIRSINEIIKSMVTKTFGEEESKKFKTKSLRDAYNDAVQKASLPKELKDTLLGHKKLIAKEKQAISQAIITESYDKAFKYLTINHGTQARKDIERLEDELSFLKKKINEKDTEIADLKSGIKRIQDTLTKQSEDTKQQLASIKEAFHAFLNTILERKTINQPRKQDHKKGPD